MAKIYSHSDLLKMLNERILTSNQRTVAAELEITPQHMNDLIQGKRNISERIAAKLGYIREIVFRRAA